MIGNQFLEVPIIDFHTHPFIDECDNLCMYKDSVIMDSNTVITDMLKAGITYFCGSVINNNFNGFECLKKSNRDALKLREIYNGMYIPGIHIHPHYIDESIKEIDKAVENDIHIIGELVPYNHGWSDYSCKELFELLEYVNEKKFIVSVHTMDMGQMEVMAREHKNIIFVFAHPGDRNRVEEHIKIMKKCDNVHIDLSGSGLHRYGVVKYLVDNVGSERILFGTDYPISNLAMYVNAVLSEKITEQDKRNILFKNAQRLLEI